jgi:hypothetical protein
MDQTKISNNPERGDVSRVGKKTKSNPWVAVSFVLGLVVIVLLVLNFTGINGNATLSADDAGDKLTNYLNERTGGGVEYKATEDKGNLYQVTVSYQNQEIPVFITKDGKYFVQGALLIETPTDNSSTQTPTQTPPTEVLKSDKPKVELFVMTYCPYGTQAEKGIISAFEALGNKIDANIRFVHYFMHGDKEEQETYTQICIREEQKDKYLNYLQCFLEAGDSASCITKTKVSQTKLDSCVKNRAKGLYDKDSELSKGYGVQGSPTLVINGQEASSGRDSASYLSAICSAFNESPEECAKKLSSQSPSPGFGTSASSGSAATESCG